MSIPDRVNAFLAARRPNRFCYDCIAEILEPIGTNEIQKAASVLATTDGFRRAPGVCSMCGNEKAVIQRA